MLVTTGLRDELPDIPGLRDRWAKDVLHCPYCHGWEVRDQPLGVLWHGPDTVQLRPHRAAVDPRPRPLRTRRRLTARTAPQLDARAIGVVEGDIDRLRRRGRPPDRRRADRRARHPHGARVFVPPRFVPHDDLLAGLGCELDDTAGSPPDANGATSVPGVWVAGNVANPRAQVITAAGEGSAAAIAINNDLVEADVRAAVELFNAGAAR